MTRSSSEPAAADVGPLLVAPVCVGAVVPGAGCAGVGPLLAGTR